MHQELQPCANTLLIGIRDVLQNFLVSLDFFPEIRQGASFYFIHQFSYELQYPPKDGVTDVLVWAAASVSLDFRD